MRRLLAVAVGRTGCCTSLLYRQGAVPDERPVSPRGEYFSYSSRWVSTMRAAADLSASAA